MKGFGNKLLCEAAVICASDMFTACTYVTDRSSQIFRYFVTQMQGNLQVRRNSYIALYFLYFYLFSFFFLFILSSFCLFVLFFPSCFFSLFVFSLFFSCHLSFVPPLHLLFRISYSVPPLRFFINPQVLLLMSPRSQIWI